MQLRPTGRMPWYSLCCETGLLTRLPRAQKVVEGLRVQVSGQEQESLHRVSLR